MKIAQEDAILNNNLCKRGIVHEGYWANILKTVGNVHQLYRLQHILLLFFSKL